jgi:hypothetical protein
VQARHSDTYSDQNRKQGSHTARPQYAKSPVSRRQWYATDNAVSAGVDVNGTVSDATELHVR